ncbi:MAG: hypothetical protein JNN15_11460 [Blastocatellia bacterium]|nr:hypothetical protein [Blastocatellia bacterium]
MKKPISESMRLKFLPNKEILETIRNKGRFMQVINRSKLSQTDFNAAVAELTGHKLLQDVMKWLLKQEKNLSKEIVEVVAQDEFTYDIVVRYANKQALVYDTNFLGVVKSLSVWDQIPTAEEILKTRLAEGWSPTPSELKSGKRVLGYASCLTQAKHL